MEHIPVRKAFWDSLVFALNNQVKRLAKDIGVSLGVPEKALLNALKEETNVYLFDEEADQVDISEMRCKYLVSYSEVGRWLVPCSAPVVWSSRPGMKRNLCFEHSMKPVQTHRKLPISKKIEDDKIVVEDIVYSLDGAILGRYDPVSKAANLFKEL
jgi:hypothetical protein